jgi:hypothetical protein
VGVAWTLVRAASAATTNIVLSISGCEAAVVPADRLFDLARAELAPYTVIPGDAAHDVQAPHLYVRLCQASANAVRLEWQNTRAAVVARQLDLSDVIGDLRARTLAVALAELVASAPVNSNAVNLNDNGVEQTTTNATVKSAEPNQTPPWQPAQAWPPSAHPQAVARTEPIPHETARAPALRASAGAVVREFFSPRTSLVGPWLSVASGRFAGEAQFLTTQKDATQGALNLGTVTLYDADLAGIYRAFSWGSAIVTSANLRVEVGNTWASGEPSRGVNILKQPTKSNARMAAALDFMAETPIAGNIGLQLHLLLGGNVGGGTARAVNQAVVGTEGIFTGAALGLHYEIVE